MRLNIKLTNQYAKESFKILKITSLMSFIVIKNQIRVPNSENLLYLNPGTYFFDLSAKPYLFDLANVRAKIVLNFELKDFPIYFSRVSSK
jgi:hypothetical protein